MPSTKQPASANTTNVSTLMTEHLTTNSDQHHWQQSMKPKKVLIIQQMIPEYRIGFFNRLKSELAKEQVELSLVFGNNSTNYKSGPLFYEIDWGKSISNKTIKIGRLHLCWQPVPLGYLKEFDLVIVEKSNKLLLNYYLMILRKLGTTRIAFWGHGRDLQSKPERMNNRFGLLFLRQCDWWFAYTSSVKEYIAAKKFPAAKITVVQNAIDTNQLQKSFDAGNDCLGELKRKLGIDSEKVGIFCGGMYPNKRIGFLIDACLLIRKSIPDFQMIFIGDGEESYKVKNAAEKYPWVHYAGSINGAERIKYFKIAAVQLMPGLVGLGILDSFAMETPIITTSFEFHSPEIEYLENGINGIITKDNLTDYAAEVIRILDTKSYLGLIPGCRIAAKKYTIGRMVDNFKEGILSALASKRGK